MNTEEQFAERYKDFEFRHKEELVAGLTSGVCRLQANSAEAVSCGHLLNVYRRRAKHLLRYNTPHAQMLRDDTLALCDELERRPNDNCIVRSFSRPPYSVFMVVEAAENGVILGCLFGADKRLMPSDEWEQLWRGDGSTL